MVEEKRTNVVGVVLMLIITMIFIGCVAVGLSSCTYSITMVHTQGEAADVVDETATNTPSTSVTPTLTIPASAL
jgi:hypothetical protein